MAIMVEAAWVEVTSEAVEAAGMPVVEEEQVAEGAIAAVEVAALAALQAVEGVAITESSRRS